MKALAAALATSALLANGCTVVKIDKGDTTTIEHAPGPEIAKDLSNRACRRAGQQSAEIVSSVNKDPSLPAGVGRQITTFRCSARAQPQT